LVLGFHRDGATFFMNGLAVFVGFTAFQRYCLAATGTGWDMHNVGLNPDQQEK
jgi:hypothetical protein